MKNAGLIALLAVLLAASTALGASEVTNVRLSYNEGQTIARIDVIGDVRFAHQTEVAKDGRPYRVIVDILSAVHDLGGKTFESMPPCVVSGIRTSQYSVTPEKTVRVVFDMTGETVYQIAAVDKAVRLTFPDPKAKPYAEWSTRDVVLAAEAEKHSRGFVAAEVSEQTVPTPKASKTAGELNRALNKDRMASLADSKAGQPPAPKAAPAVTPDKAPEQTVQQPTVPIPTGSARKFSATDWYEQPETAPPVAIESPKPAAVTNPDKPAAQPMAQLAAVDETPEPIPSSPIVVKTQPKAPAAAKAEPKAPVVTRTEPKIPTVVKTETTPPAAEKSGPPAPPTESVEQEVAPAAEPQSDDQTRPTSRFRRAPVQSSKMKGSLVAEFPQRLVIQYNSSGRRDPFETLINEARVFDSPMAERIPNIEGLRLVGVIQSAGSENSALFEDSDNYSYILRAGDKVRRGYVLRVEQDRVFFQVFEYGWSRTVALNIEN